MNDAIDAFGMTLDPTRAILLFFIIPLWIAAGLADWLCHRVTEIEHTSGVTESLLHHAQFAQVGTGLLLALLLEINTLIIGILIALFILHEATAMWDVRYAAGRRDVRPIEQHVHSFLEMLPLMALVMVIALHWPQAQSLVGAGSEAPRLTFAWKPEPLPASYIASVLIGAFAFGIVPYGEELIRCLRARHPRGAVMVRPR